MRNIIWFFISLFFSSLCRRICREGLKVGKQSPHGGIVVSGIAGHLRLRVFSLRVVHVGHEVLGRGCGKGGENWPGIARFPSAFVTHVVTAETILLRDAIAGLHHRVGCVRARWRNRAEHNFLVADLELHYAPRNLRLIVVRQNLV